MSWYAVKPEVTPGGDVGGDYQAGEAWNVRLWNDDLPSAVVDIYVYAEARTRGNTEIPSGQYGVTVMTEYTVCADRTAPGDTEEWADMRYDTTDARSFADLGPADTAAKSKAEDYARNAAEYITWNGQPIYS